VESGSAQGAAIADSAGSSLVAGGSCPVPRLWMDTVTEELTSRIIP
jgi:hypothetical protein